jgi:predicted dehydrogenase
MALRIGIIGYGKIAADQHVPSIAANPGLELAATVSRQGKGEEGIPSFTSHEEMIAHTEALDAVAICTPPSARYEIARACLEAGLHCLLEKPPGISLGEVEELARFARERERTLFTTWHAQNNGAVAAAAGALENRRIALMRIVWREDVRKWHPGQQWIWEPGGFGVFDPGINALSIASRILPGALFVRRAELLFPSNRQAPIAARLSLAGPCADGPMEAEFDWRHSGGEAWDIDVEATDGLSLRLGGGGTRLMIDGEAVETPGGGEYPALYAHFLELVGAGCSHVDLVPLRLAADAFLLGRRSEVEPFVD